LLRSSKAQRAQATGWESLSGPPIAAYFDFVADEHQSWLAKRRPEEPHLYLQVETPEMQAVFAEVRDCIVDEYHRAGTMALTQTFWRRPVSAWRGRSAIAC